MSVPKKDRRNAIIYRKDGYTTTVQASAIKDIEELAYAIGFLAHHRLYKMSKEGGVNQDKAQGVAAAFMLAAEAFQRDVIDPLCGKRPKNRISSLGDRKVSNPFTFV